MTLEGSSGCGLMASWGNLTINLVILFKFLRLIVFISNFGT